MIIHAVRAIYLLVLLAFTVSFAFQPTVYNQGQTYATLYILIPMAAGLGLVLLDMFWRKKHLQALSGLFFGLLAGLVLAYGVSLIVNLVGNVFILPTSEIGQYEAVDQPMELAPQAPDALADEADQPAGPSQAALALSLIKVWAGVSAVYLCVSFVLQTKDDFRFVIPYVEFTRQTKGARPLLLDTSVIIDGRIADIAETHVLDGEMVVPRFVLTELQAIADSDDKLKRNRGRRGLDVLNRLQEGQVADIRILDAQVPSVDEVPDVDAKLVALGQHLDGRVVTTDYNLNKIAQLRGVDVININDLANALKPVVLPGEKLAVKIIRAGEEAGQGVGFLEDGTMIVAERGREHIGQQIEIVTTSVLQTSAGKMIFGRYEG